MGYNTKNYTEHGGEKTVIGGEIEINGKITLSEGAEAEGFPPYTLPQATADTLGGIKVGSGLSIEDGVLSADSQVTPAENQVDSEATTIANLKEDFNALLAKLKTAGLMEADEDTSGGDNE